MTHGPSPSRAPAGPTPSTAGPTASSRLSRRARAARQGSRSGPRGGQARGGPMASATIGTFRSGDRPVEVVRVGILDLDLHDVAGLQRARHVAQVDRAVDLRRIGLAAAG